ncbi:LOW QUALITY PROTEIN: RNA exonuclease 1 homolog [Myotis daubentonii]|uniref:LOW QUALITY PROTEIN: RNA exonuclease 1 homolog n=1 Tax=Myotis daubentonii TaxID=98922 RepID=UPI00287337F0|nr:LOW QUALITY PROTEIN: RNA exonuclease 1 homolog [Myotis daubentonii]
MTMCFSPPREEKAEDKEPLHLTALSPGQEHRTSHLTKQGKETQSHTPRPESVRRGWAPRTRLPTTQEMCDLLRGAHKAPMKSASVPQAAQQPAPKHLSAARDKRRIARVPMPCLGEGAKRRLLASSSSSSSSSRPPSRNQGLGSQLPEAPAPSGQASMATSPVPPTRLARGPPVQTSQKPVPPTQCGGKVPAITPQRRLSLFMDKGLKFCSSTQEATGKELKEEKAADHQSPSKRIDPEVANTFHNMQGLEPGPGAGLLKTRDSGAVSQEVVPGGKLAAQTSFWLQHPHSLPEEDPLPGATLYQRLKEHLLTQAQLKENGYPFAHPTLPGGAVLFTAQEKPPQDASCRLCCRCGTQYLVAPSGRCVRQEECRYHWGRLRPTPAAGGWQIQYTCCSAAIGSPGCQVARQHVQDGRQQDLQGFVHTVDKELPAGAHPGIYALDCEMCYTTAGLELTRVSVVDSALRLVYDTFVRPDRDIVDYNTRFSGVTAAHLAHTSTSIRDVQAALLTLFNSRTILIGHSLQSDLLALKLIHGTVLDTSVLFPHRRGLPYKRSLRNLAAHYLGHVIQDRTDGHSSSEDASACMRLVIWKMGQHADTQRDRSPAQCGQD